MTTFDELQARQALRSAGWRWDPFPVARWYQTDPERVTPWLRHCDSLAQHHLNGNAFLDAAGLEASAAGDMPIELPCPPGLAYLPYQRAGIATGLTRNNLLLADEMGLGKTVQAIGIVNADPTIMRILIVCPASLRLNWEREWSRWCTRGIEPRVVRPGGGWPRIAASNGLMRMKACVIISYHMVHKHKAQILEWQPDALIADESHNLKSTKTRMTRAVLGWGRPGAEKSEAPIRATRTVFLTGTPVLNRPGELWSTVRRLDPKGLGASRPDFEARYVHEQRHDELNHRLRSSIMIRRQKQDVLSELPPKRRQLVPLEIPNARELLQLENAALASERTRIAALKAAVENAKGTEGYKQAVMHMNQGKRMSMQEIAKARHQTALAKLPTAIEHIKGVLEDVEKAIVFFHHIDVGNGLTAAFKDHCLLTGSSSPVERQSAVDRFQRDGVARIFLGSLRAAGVGITLTAASTVIFVELDWTPAMMSQAEDRAHRIGQRDSVLVQHLVVDGSIDARMAKILVEKQAMLDAVLGDAPPVDADDPDPSVFDALLQTQA